MKVTELRCAPLRLGSACYKEGSLGLILELAPDKQAAHGLSLAPGGKTSANFKHTTPFKRTLYGGVGGRYLLWVRCVCV